MAEYNCEAKMCLHSATVIVRDTELVKDYEQLENKPRINGVELVGNRTSDELHVSGGAEPAEPGEPDEDYGDLPIATDEDIDGLFH